MGVLSLNFKVCKNWYHIIIYFIENSVFSNVISKDIKGFDLKSFNNKLNVKDKLFYRSKYDSDSQKVDPPKVRWVSNKRGSTKEAK